MARKGASLSALPILLLILLAATGENWMVGVEGRICESQSLKFRGSCLSESNCANVCHNEGFPGGDCKGFRRRCFCTRHC